MTDLNRQVCVAPMMDYTDRHCRYFLRLLSPSALLYTEMVTSKALLHGDVERLLGFAQAEQPVALQLGGCDPDELANAARLGESYGYREINLNCGCPSDRVQSGRFGACLMGEPERVRDCVAAMRAVVKVPVTVKCRIGIEPGMNDQSDVDFLNHFVQIVRSAGCDTFIVHARRAVLAGLSPKENREIPPLRYEVALALKQQHPTLSIVLNGGITTSQQVTELLQQFDGVMIGREAYHNPYLLARLHQQRHGGELPDRHVVIERYASYVLQQLANGQRLSTLLRPILGLYLGQPRARSWRRFLSEQMALSPFDDSLLLRSLKLVA